MDNRPVEIGMHAAVTASTPDQSGDEVTQDMAIADFIAPPAFQFYASDFLGSTKVGRMSLTEIGIFTLLLCHAWNANGLPIAVPEIARLARVPLRRFTKLWSGVLAECWVERRGRFVNPRQEEIRRELIAFRQSRRENGKKGGRPKLPESKQKPTGKPRPKLRESSPVSSLPSTDVSKEQKHLAAHPVKAFLTLYETSFSALHGDKPVITARDAKIAKDTITNVGEEKAARLLTAFFASPDPFIVKTGHGLNVFAGQINKLIADAGPRLAATGTEGRGRTGAPPRGKYDGVEERD